MKQFDLKEYLKNPNKKVVTRDGRNVRIICTDRQGGDRPILALCFASDGIENCFACLPNGRRYVDTDSCMDLFFICEKHEGWINLYKDIDNRIMVGSSHPIKSEKEAKMSSKEPDYVATCKITWEE